MTALEKLPALEKLGLEPAEPGLTQGRPRWRSEGVIRPPICCALGWFSV